jgi:hypothetical protein
MPIRVTRENRGPISDQIEPRISRITQMHCRCGIHGEPEQQSNRQASAVRLLPGRVHGGGRMVEAAQQTRRSRGMFAGHVFE